MCLNATAYAESRAIALLRIYLILTRYLTDTSLYVYKSIVEFTQSLDRL